MRIFAMSCAFFFCRGFDDNVRFFVVVGVVWAEPRRWILLSYAETITCLLPSRTGGWLDLIDPKGTFVCLCFVCVFVCACV